MVWQPCWMQFLFSNEKVSSSKEIKILECEKVDSVRKCENSKHPEILEKLTHI